MSSIVSTHHVGLNCKNLAVTERFYERHFGFRRSRVVDLGKTQIIFVKSGAFYLELFEGKGDPLSGPPKADGPPETGTWRHLAFSVDSVDEKLAEMGDDAKINLGPLSFDDFIPGWRAVWLADPDGRIIEVCQGYRDL